ncbi:MAG: S-layer y domain protein [Firmicutes bacterium]|nr:S-layer y domain protein [Bacillota bacterium]
MKKGLVVTLVLIFVLGIAGTAFAANLSNFNDVPKTHWSYAAIKKLADAGIIDGANGNFNGDKTLTRYEMAVIVANALTKEEKADAETKALINKLVAEYKADMEGMGIRLQAVEQKANKVQFGGYLGFRYQKTTNAIWPLTAAHMDLFTTLNLDDKTFVGMEKEMQAAYKTNEYTQAYAGGTYDSDFEQLYVDTALGDKTRLTVGRFSNKPAYAMTFHGNMDGARLTFDAASKLKAAAAYGTVHDTDRYYLAQVTAFNNYGTTYDYPAYIDARMPYYSVSFDYAAAPTTNVKAAYQHISDWKTVGSSTVSGSSIIYTAPTWAKVNAHNFYELGFDTKLNNDLALTTVGVKSSAQTENKAYFAQLMYKQAAFWAVPHSYDVFVNYRKVPYNTTVAGVGGNLNDFYGDDNNSSNFKGTTVGFHYVPKRMTQLTCFYQMGKTVDTNVDKKIFRTQFDYFF